MLGTNFTVPILAAMAGALMSTWINPQGGMMWGAGVGFGAGCAIVALIWLLFAVIKRMVD